MSNNLLDHLSRYNGSRVATVTVEHDGQEFTVHMRVLSSGVAMRVLDARGNNGKADPEKAKKMRDKFLASVLTNEEGTLKMTEAETTLIEVGLANKLEKLAIEVNGLNQKAAEDAGKSSPTTDD